MPLGEAHVSAVLWHTARLPAVLGSSGCARCQRHCVSCAPMESGAQCSGAESQRGWRGAWEMVNQRRLHGGGGFGPVHEGWEEITSQQGEAVCIPRRGAGGKVQRCEQGGGGSAWLSVAGVKGVGLVCGLERQVQRAHGAPCTTPRSSDIALTRRHDQESQKALTREGTPGNLC